MKKFLTLIITLCVLDYAYAQNQNAIAKWGIAGNSTATTDFMGTTNNAPLIFKTNNTERLQLDAQGKLILNSGKEMVINPSGLIRPEKANPIAAYMLKVGGSGHFDGELNSRQLFVQEYISYMKSLKGPRIDVDTIKMDDTRGIFGNTKIFGDVQIKQNMEVAGTTTLKGDLIAEKGFTFDGNNGMRFFPATATRGVVYQLGGPTPIPLSLIPCPNPNINALPQFINPGGFVSLVPLGSGVGSTNASLTFQTVPWDGSGLIEVSGVGPSGAEDNGLLINYFCGRNTSINTGWDLDPNNLVDGGRVIMGAEVQMQRSLKIGYSGTSVIDPKTAIEINQNTDNAKGVNVKTSNNSIKAFSISNTNFVNPSFVVYGDGETAINTLAIDAFTIKNASSNTINFKVKNTGFVYAREVNVQIGTFPDYVFKNEYKLLPLDEVEKYIKINNHLKGFENADYYQKNGLELGEVVKLQQEKIEELTLYLIELKKEIDNLKNAK